MPKFNGRLTFIKNKKYSGKKSVSQNMGLKLASGEYVLFSNSGDLLATTALETLYNAAKENDADVIYTSVGYDLNRSNDITLLRDAEGSRLLMQGLEDKPTLTIDDADKNLQQLLVPESCCNLWTRFVRRDLLVKNKIVFPEISDGEDFIWLINVVCHAKRFLRLPTPLYFCKHDNAAADDLQENVQERVDKLIAFMQALKKLSSDNKALQEVPDYCTKALELYFEKHFGDLFESNTELSKSAVRETLHNEFNKETASAKSFMSLLANTEKTAEKVTEPGKKKEFSATSYQPHRLLLSL